eukprot:474914_1
MNDTIITMNKAKKRLAIIKQQLSPKSTYIQQQYQHNMVHVHGEHSSHSVYQYTIAKTFDHNYNDRNNNNINKKHVHNPPIHHYPTPKSELSDEGQLTPPYKMEEMTKIFDSVPDQYLCLLCKKQGDHWIMNCPKRRK